MLAKIYTVDEDKLIKRCQNKDRAAQKYLFEKYKSILFGIILRYVKNKATAEDLLSDVFIQIFDKVHTFKFKGSFEGWMKRIAVNQSLMFLRKQKDVTYTNESFLLDKEQKASALHQLQHEDIIACIKALPDGYRTIFNLYVIEGYKHREIAEMLDISIHTSKSQLIMARKKLREFLEARDYPGLKNYES
jgi:RNA polymerase sigma-70 factor (ECF subfamily)